MKYKLDNARLEEENARLRAKITALDTDIRYWRKQVLQAETYPNYYPAAHESLPVVESIDTERYWKEVRSLMAQLQNQVDSVDAKGSARMRLLQELKRDIGTLQKDIEEVRQLVKSCMLWPRYPPIEEP
jgi:phage shock protein A